MRPSLSFLIGPNSIQLDVLPMHDSIFTDSLLRAEQNKLNLHDSISREMLLQISSSKVLAAYKAKEIELKLRPAASEEEEQQIWADLDEWGSTTIAETIKDMKGLVYTHTASSSRVPG